MARLKNHRYQSKRFQPDAQYQLKTASSFQPNPVSDLSTNNIMLTVRPDNTKTIEEYELLYRAWSTYHLPVALESDGELGQILYHYQSAALPNHYEIFGCQPVTKQSLLAYLQIKMPGAHKIQWGIAWQENSQCKSLGQVSLGQDACLGKRVPCRYQLIEIFSVIQRHYSMSEYHTILMALSDMAVCIITWQIIVRAESAAAVLGKGVVGKTCLAQQKVCANRFVIRSF